MTQPNIAQELERAYARASMNETAKLLQDPQDWQRFQDIQQRSEEARQREEHSFRQDYDVRLSAAREAILNERAAPHLTHPSPRFATGQDRFNKDQINRQAHLRVHHDHHQRLNAIDAQAKHDVQQLLQQSGQDVPQNTQAQERQIQRER